MFDEAQRETLRAEINRILDESVGALMDAGHLESGSVIVLGCSTSEITGARIGKGSVPELGEMWRKRCWRRARGTAFMRRSSAAST